MKTFLAIYTGTPESRERAGWDSLNEAERQARERAGIEAWGKWVETNRAAIVDTGSPLGRTKRVSDRGIADIRNDLVAYAVVRAASHAEAANLFVQHPHFTIFPGEAIEIMECLPMPG
ncbi:hypothetical protein GCM10027084_01240 [Pseudoxanthomonas sangjuensis]|uniref:hypothetical protein n=1 Tax=Pseudoxanthomonas sangjuensis TaxID=1503750 RepID=UPI001391958A|nr:hypothetical protein [Pseudoxanthomonas sangjuensis]KAF1707523.1 hypothetical protein CSC71_12945 [Pseudoxanthomonas sangjuensis]